MHSKGNNKKVKRKSMDLEKIFTHDGNDMGLISKIHRQLVNSTTTKWTTQFKILSKDLNTHFSEEDMNISQ